MTTFLSTLFAISLFAVVYILSVKTLEEKRGKSILMPGFINSRDEEIRRNFEYFGRRILHVGKYKTQIAGHKIYNRVKTGTENIAVSGRKNGDVPKGNGNGSVFLKRVKKHKKEIRENGGNGNIE